LGALVPVATLDNWDNANRSYTFTNLSALLPIANYHATVSVVENAKGSALKMTATYDAKSVTDADANPVMRHKADAATPKALGF
jgi:hypothetical protein